MSGVGEYGAIFHEREVVALHTTAVIREARQVIDRILRAGVEIQTLAPPARYTAASLGPPQCLNAPAGTDQLSVRARCSG